MKKIVSRQKFHLPFILSPSPQVDDLRLHSYFNDFPNNCRSEIIVVAEEAVAEMPLDNIEYFHEKFILDYFAEVGLFLKNDCPVWAEVTLRRLIRLRCEAPTIGPNHEETYHLQKYLELSLRMQKGKKKRKEANELADKLESIGKISLNNIVS